MRTIDMCIPPVSPALASNLSKEQMNKLLMLILDCLQNETTRIVSIKTLSTVASAFDSDSMDDDNKIDLSPILGDSIMAMASFLKKQSWSLKQSSLEVAQLVCTHLSV